uniref:BppU family phage baseplate upper protein n=1 Tax=Peptoniphilus rhinitidis TaxID=1175452 RepID=UPI000288C789
MINNEIIKLKFDNSFNGRLFAVQGDTGRVFNLQVFDDFSKPVDVTGMKLRMYVANSKEVSYSEGEIVEAAEGKIKVQVYNSQLKYPGKQKAQFIITDKDGQKIGSKIFDLWIEEGLEAGPTVGRNIYVDFEKINEALELIKDYDKTLEEAKEVDASLKVGINEGIEARNNLADCKKKALEIKGQLDNSKTDANKTLENLKTTKTESETLKSNLTSENQKATENIKDLTNKIDTGKTASNELNTSIEDAKANKTNLDKSNTTALSTKKSLEDVTTTANTTKENLSNLKSQGDTLSGDLTTKITDGNKLKSNLDTSISNAATAKSNLDTSVETATSTNTTLKATDTKAKKTEALIKDLMNQLNLTKDEVSKIIAAGDLSKYVTDPKLQEVLESYATKEDLSSIDVTGQLVDYAKKTQIPTKLSQLTNDKTYKTESEIQAMINNSVKLKKEVVTSLPSTGKDDVIYLLKNKADTNNYYTEYMWISGKWEIIGDTKVDLSEYLKTVNLSSTKLRTNKSNTNVFTDRSTSDHQLDIILGDLELRTEENKKNIESRAKSTDIKIKLSEMKEDSTHRTVSDSEKQSWNKKFELPDGKENQVLTKTAEGAEFKEISSSRSATFVIANYDSSENSKAGADYVIQENDCAAEIINNFIAKLPEYGGKIQLTEGNFNIKKNLAISFTKNNVIIEGYGNSTNIIDKLTKGERNQPIVNISKGITNCRLAD